MEENKTIGELGKLFEFMSFQKHILICKILNLGKLFKGKMYRNLPEVTAGPQGTCKGIV